MIHQDLRHVVLMPCLQKEPRSVVSRATAFILLDYEE